MIRNRLLVLLLLDARYPSGIIAQSFALDFADSYVVQDFRPVAPNRWLFWIVNRGTNQSTPLLRYRDYGKGQRPSATPTMQRIDEDLDVSNTWKVFYIVSPRLFALCMRAGFWSYRNAFEDIFTKPPQAAIRRVNDVTFNADGRLCFTLS